MDAAILASNKTQHKIAQEMGYENVNNLSLIKKERTHLPVDKVIPFANAVGVPVDDFMMMFLEERMPVLYSYIIDREQRLYGAEPKDK